MVDPAILNTVQNYLKNLSQKGIPVHFAVLFGSQATGMSGPWSDIDLIVVSTLFDWDFSRTFVDQLWRVAAGTDSRIEPIPCGARKWQEDDTLPLIEKARREGIQIKLDSVA